MTPAATNKTRFSEIPRYTRKRIPFHPGAGISEGVSADRPRPVSPCVRSSLAGRASPDRRRVNPNAISRALNPIVHNVACSDALTSAGLRTSVLLMRLLYNTRILPSGLLPYLLVDERGSARRSCTGALPIGCRPGHHGLPDNLLSGSLVSAPALVAMLISAAFPVADCWSCARDDRPLAIINHATPTAIRVSGIGF